MGDIWKFRFYKLKRGNFEVLKVGWNFRGVKLFINGS